MLARLERIEALERERCPARRLLAELRALLTEAEAWARAERTVPEDGDSKPCERCRRCLPAEIGRNSSRTLLA